MTSTLTRPQIRAGIDWGSSSFRAYRFDNTGAVIDSIQSNDGIKSVVDGQYEECLFKHIESWVQPGDTVLLSGMITSRTGWQETPYIPCPATPASDASKLVKIVARGIDLLFMPGLSQIDPSADVMRGEELQLLGATASNHSALRNASSENSLSENESEDENVSLIILPGTHSKWALTAGASILAFKTIATGELFDCLVKHSLIAAFAEPKSWDAASYLRGVKEGYQTNQIISLLFSARAGVLLEKLTTDQVYAYLSGLLIGNEIKEGQAFARNAHSHDKQNKLVTLVGSELLCDHYQRALEALDIAVAATHTDAAAAGFSRIVQDANTSNV